MTTDSTAIVLLFSDGGQFVEMGYFRGEGYFELERTDPQDYPIRYEVDRITHWMPLPEAPARLAEKEKKA